MPRFASLLNLHASDARLDDLEGGYLRVLGKGDQERIIPLIDAPRTVRLLRETLKASGVGPLFRGNSRKGGRPGEPIDYTTVLYHFEQYVSLAQSKRRARTCSKRKRSRSPFTVSTTRLPPRSCATA